MVVPSETERSQLIYNWFKIGTFQHQIWQFLQQNSHSLDDVMQKEIDILEFVQGVKFDFIELLKSTGAKYLLIFDNSCGEISHSKAFVDIAISGRHRGLSTIYIEHNLFLRSKLRRDVELQNKHIVFFRCPGDVMQNRTLSAGLDLGSELVGWYGY